MADAAAMSRSAALTLRRAIGLLLLVLWLASVAAGYLLLSAHSLEPGAAEPPSGEATAAALRAWHTAGRPLIVMALHPRCPCSEASADELADVMGWTPHAADLVLLVYRPRGETDAWTDSARHASLERFHPRVVVDEEGAFSRALGARTSGHVIAFDGRGQLAYSGGLTGGRGHRGRTDGQQALRDLLSGRGAGLFLAPASSARIRGASRSRASSSA